MGVAHCGQSAMVGALWAGWKMELDEILWSLSWTAALTPELSMIPTRSIFSFAPTGPSLTATLKGTPGLLLTFTDDFFEHLAEFHHQTNISYSLQQEAGTLSGIVDGDTALVPLS